MKENPAAKDAYRPICRRSSWGYPKAASELPSLTSPGGAGAGGVMSVVTGMAIPCREAGL